MLYPENVHIFCVVLVKSVFFLNFCAIRTFLKILAVNFVSDFIHTDFFLFFFNTFLRDAKSRKWESKNVGLGINENYYRSQNFGFCTCP